MRSTSARVSSGCRGSRGGRVMIPGSFGSNASIRPERDGGGHVDPQDLGGQDRQRGAGHDRGQDDQPLADVRGQRPGDELGEVVEDPAALLRRRPRWWRSRRRSAPCPRRPWPPRCPPRPSRRRCWPGAAPGRRSHRRRSWRRRVRAPASASTRRSFCSGETRANTAARSTASESVLGRHVRRSARRSARALALVLVDDSPTRRAIAVAVAAWSPVIIFTEMPAAWQAATAAAAAARGGPASPAAR